MYTTALLVFGSTSSTPLQDTRAPTAPLDCTPPQPAAQSELIIRILIARISLRITLIIGLIIVIITQRQQTIVDPQCSLDTLGAQLDHLGRLVVQLLEVAIRRFEAAEETAFLALGAGVLRSTEEGGIGVFEETGS